MADEEYPGQRFHQYAIYDRDDSMADLLSGAERQNINAPDRVGRTPVYTAVSNNSIKCLKILLENGADPSIAGGDRVSRMTPLHQALVDGKMEAIKLLLEHGADLNRVDNSGLSPMHLAKSIDKKEFIQVFEKEDARRKSAALSVVADLCTACEKGDIEKVKLLLKLPSPTGWELPNMTSSKESYVTPLLVAVEKGNVEIVTELLENVAALKQNPSLLHIAVSCGHLDIVKLLLKKFPKCATMEDDKNQTALHIAAITGSLPIVRCLLEWDYPSDMYRSLYNENQAVMYKIAIHVNSTSVYGKTPLYLACENGNSSVVEYLLNFTVRGKHLDRTVQGTRSSTASDQSIDSVLSSEPGQDIEYKPVQVGQIDERKEPTGIHIGGDDSIMYKPVKIWETNNYSTSSIYIAVMNGHHDIVSMLAQRGADLHLTDKVDGVNAAILLLLAVRNDDLLMLDKLLQHGVEDLNNKALEEACRLKPHFIPHLLKYKASEDKQFSINKVLMKKEFSNAFPTSEKFDHLSSVDPKYRNIFPTQAVAVRWQNLKVISNIEQAWLNCVANLHNPMMTNVNARIPLFAITRVDVSYNSLTMIPTSLLQLPSICILNVSYNQITEFPTLQNFCLDCQTLEELSVQNNKLVSLPEYIFTLPCLRFVNASSNEIKFLPATVWEAINLKMLDVSHNKLETLPAPIWTIINEQETVVSLDSVQLEENPDSLVSATSHSQKIVEKNVAGVRACHWINKVVIIDEVNGTQNNKEKGLITLRLGHNQIKIFPEFLSCCCPQLEILELSHNKMTSLGCISGYPKRLKTLDLSYNEIRSMTDWQEEFPSKCFCPQEDIDNSRRMSFMGPELLCSNRSHNKLDNLEFLELSGNKLTSLVLLSTKDLLASMVSSQTNLLDKEQAAQNLQGKLLFPNLASLTLDMNRLTSLPDEIGEQKLLKILSLKKNVDLMELPPNLGLLENLQRIEVELCPIQGPIQDVIKGAADRAQDITGFLRSVLEESEEYNCMNLMIVGSFNIGKTSLLEQLVKKSVSYSDRQHFSQRQDKNAQGTTKDGKPLSTVGIDIAHLQLADKQGKKKVYFRTWDFAGQKEYYATHQYFLSPRSLYLVVWNLTHGEPGVVGLRQWLVNIQAQAPGAPVIIVGTHLDVIQGKSKKNTYPKDWEESMITMIVERYQKVDSSMVGLPRILDVINVSTDKKKLNIEKLKNIIYDRVFILNHPARRNEKLLGHKVPKKYMRLQECIENIVRERKEKGKEPVMESSKYLLTVMNEMTKGNSTTNFRNKEDLYQATRFLHENGVLCHFKDTALKDQYFLDPQWLCDQLATVVSVKEVQQYSRQGVMRIRDLKQLYKNSDTIGRYILSLLNKFEVAVQFDNEHLLLPSLLPTDEGLEPANMREIFLKRRGVSNSPTDAPGFGFAVPGALGTGTGVYLVCTESDINPTFSNTRLYLLTYFPSGFWPRLITRILADESFSDAFDKLFPLPLDIYNRCLDLQRGRPTWRCWQSGMELVYFGNVIMQVKEVNSNSNYAQGLCNYNIEGLQMLCFFEDTWSQLNVKESSVLEISFKADKLLFNFGFQDGRLSQQSFQSIDSKVVYHDEKAQASILAKVVEHIDSLLQDWFPELGESRFQQSCTGRYLLTRVIPCPLCLHTEIKHQENSSNAWAFVAQETTAVDSHKKGEGMVQQGMLYMSEDSGDRTLCAFLVEKCIKNVLEGSDEICKVHGSVSPICMPGEDGVTRLLHVAPDAVFQDLDETFVVEDDALIVGEKLGRGAFGTVSAGKLQKGDCVVFDVAVKVLYDPDKDKKKQSSQMSLETVCASYVTARQEVSILQSVEHAHIVPLLGLSRSPLALLLALAPKGSLNRILETRCKDGLRLPVWVIKHIVIQTADALDYLHGRKIIYRDLKSDNVLVWNFPGPNDLDPKSPVLVKLADYGISRAAMPAGAKGFGGTPPFIAPEILISSGRDTYTEKVDIFSLGMFMFEVLTCRQPLADINNPTLHVSHGGRPEINSEEAVYPSHMLDLMTLCWSQDPEDRPSAAQVRMIASSAQFCHLSDAIVMETDATILSACSAYLEMNTTGQTVDETQVWIASLNGENSYFVEILSYNLVNSCTSYKELMIDNKVVYLCAHENHVWCLTIDSCLYLYSVLTCEKEASYVLPTSTVTFVHTMVCHRSGQFVILLKEQGEKGTTLLSFTEKQLQAKVPAKVIIPRPCYSASIVDTTESLKVWLGTTKGEILVRDIPEYAEDADTEREDRCLTPFGGPGSHQICWFLVTATDSPIDSSVWTYYHPGSKVYHWNTMTESVVNTLDCSTLIPTSESYRVSRRKQFEANQYQVTAILPVDKYLYVSTTWGCVIVADAQTMQPYSVFRCHGNQEFYCKAILPLGPSIFVPPSKTPQDNDETCNKTDDQLGIPQNIQLDKQQEVLYDRTNSTDLFKRSISQTQESMSKCDRGVVTIGRGYVDIVEHVCGLDKKALTPQPRRREEWSDQEEEEKTDKRQRNTKSTFVLSWMGKQWEWY